MFMNENKPNVDDLENEFDLSSMIDEYDEDKGLRQKIEQMKQAKAMEKQKQQDVEAVNVEDSALFVTKQSVVKQEKYSAYGNMEEDELGKTRVLPTSGVGEDMDKTLVIMDSKRGKSFEKQDDEDEESIFVYDNRQVDEEEITEEDIKEFLGEEKKPSKPPMDPNKKNKIITMVICGCIGLVLLIGVGFGVKMLLDSNSQDSEKIEEKEEDNKKDEPIAKDPESNQSNTNKPTPETPKTDNSIRIAEIKGEVKGLQTNLTTLNESLKDKSQKREAAQNSSKEVQDKISPIQSKVDNELKQDMEVKEASYNDLKTKFDAGDKTVTEVALNDAKTKMEAAQKAWNEQVQEIQKLNTEKAVFDKAITELNDEITSINSQIEECNSKISQLNTELDSLQ